MFPRDADVRRAHRRYPDVTCAERRALWRWDGRADAVELPAVVPLLLMLAAVALL